MAFNLENMTIDYKKMLRMVPSDRTSLAQSGAVSDLISSLTPGQLVNLFPRYYRDQLPDVGKAVSSLGGALSGGTNLSGGSGGSTYTPDTSKPVKSPSAEETAIQNLLREANVLGEDAAKPGTEGLEPGRQQRMKMTYDAFTAAGFSHRQSLALTAEVGRENGYQEKFMFGTHSDPYNNATNLGMLSMQGPRLTNLKEALKAEGRFDVNGELIRDQETMNAMARFYMNEMQTSENTKKTQEFLSNPDIDPQRAAELLGKGYIRWRYDDPRYAHHHEFRNRYYNEADNITAQYVENIESAGDEINNLETVITKFDPGMIDQLDERMKKWYENAGEAQKKRFETALERLGVERFNQEMKNQPVNNVTLQAVTIASDESRVSEEQAGFRSSPLKPELRNALEYAAEQSGLYVKVFSGGQTEEQQAALKASGSDPSNRHDIQNPDTPGAADVRLAYKDVDGNEVILDQSNPEHWPMIAKFVKNSSRTIESAGVGGWSPNDNYMGKTSMHIGGPNKKGDAPLAYQGMEFFKQAHAEGVALREQDQKNDYDPLAEWTKKKQEENNKKAEEAVAARVNSDPVTAAQNNMQPPPTEVPALPAAEIPAVAAPGLSIGGTVPMTPGENIAGVNMTTGKLEFMSNDRELYTKDDSGNLRVDPSTIRQEDQKAEVASAEPQRVETQNQPMQRKPEQPMPVSTPDPNFLETMSSGSMASSPSQLRALNRAKLYGENSGNLVNGHFS